MAVKGLRKYPILYNWFIIRAIVGLCSIQYLRMKRFTVHAGGALLLFFMVGILVIPRYLNMSKVAQLKQNQHLYGEQFRSPKTILHINPAFTIRSRLEYIPVKILGACGETWSCGRKYVPDDCYKILNKYRFFLSFENSLCRQYFTEKVFESYRYDTILITRGGNKGEANSLFPNSTFISTDDFDTIERLGRHLQKLSHSTDEYAYMLSRKDEYYSVSFREMYERAMCDVCKRLHDKKKYRKTIPDTRQWLMDSLPCRNPDDIK